MTARRLPAFLSRQPRGPFRRERWRSPLRGPWLTAVLGFVLLVGVPVVFVTGLASYAAYNPDLGGNDMTPDKGPLGFYLFSWPTRPSWLYRAVQGTHVTLGLMLVPVVLSKLWSVLPKLFDWPPARSPAQRLERLSLFLLVGGAVFELATRIINIQYWYVFPAGFYDAHLYGAWVFIAAFAAHVTIKLGRMRTALRSRRLRDELRTDIAHIRPEPPDPDRLVSPNPAMATMSRRGALGLMGAGSLLIGGLSVGQNLGGWTRSLALLSPRGQTLGSGPNGFQVNKTAAYRNITAAETGPAWRLELAGPTPRRLSRDQLLDLPQRTAHLAINCVEGWSTGTQTWIGVRLADLAALAGAADADRLLVESLQQSGAFRSVTLRRNQIADRDSLLALRVNGADLALDHGFPARVMVPAAPGVHNTKWVSRLTFEP